MLFHLEDDGVVVEGTVVSCPDCKWVQDFDTPTQAWIAAEYHDHPGWCQP
jgi:hypothetical protein